MDIEKILVVTREISDSFPSKDIPKLTGNRVGVAHTPASRGSEKTLVSDKQSSKPSALNSKMHTQQQFMFSHRPSNAQGDPYSMVSRLKQEIQRRERENKKNWADEELDEQDTTKDFKAKRNRDMLNAITEGHTQKDVATVLKEVSSRRFARFIALVAHFAWFVVFQKKQTVYNKDTAKSEGKESATWKNGYLSHNDP